MAGTVEIDQLERLLDGRLLDEFDTRITSAQTEIDRAETIAEHLQSSNNEHVIKAIEGILKGEVESITGTDLKFLKRKKHQHPNTPLLNACIKANVPAYLHGEAGSAKTHAAETAAYQHGLDFRSISLSPSLMDSRLLGYYDANGIYVSTAFRDVFENGGVFLFDEMDNANPSSLAVLNNALANTSAEFADGRVNKHDKTRIVAAANTIGKGPDALYVGRSTLDAATLDRFAFIPWDISNELEKAIVLGEGEITPVDIGQGGVPTPEEWIERVQTYRDRVRSNGMRHVITMRAGIYGKALAEAGVGLDHLDEMLIFKGMAQKDRDVLIGR